MQNRLQFPDWNRRGVILPLAGFCLSIILAVAAFSVDLGFICLARSEIQNCADAAALAGAGELYPDPHPQTAVKLPLSLPIYQPARPTPQLQPAIAAACALSSSNRCGNQSSLTLLESDIGFSIYDRGVTVGPTPTLPLVDGLLDLLNLRTADATFVNACQVTVRRDATANEPLNLFFAPLLGRSQQSFQMTATAAIQRGYGLGPGDKMLPFAMDITIWNALRFTNGEMNAVTLKPLGVDLDSITLSGLLGSGGLLGLLDQVLPLSPAGSPVHVLDGFTWTRGMSDVRAGADGILEVVLLADQVQVVNKLGLLGKLLSSVTRIPSLFVTLETGVSAGSAPSALRLNEVILNGLSSADLANVSGSSSGEVWLPFTTSAYFEIPDECEAALQSIIGQPRILPLYATLPGTINKVTDVLGFPHSVQLVGWAGVVITEVNLRGPVRYINLQPAIYARHTVLPATGGHAGLSSSTMSDGVFTTPRLIR